MKYGTTISFTLILAMATTTIAAQENPVQKASTGDTIPAIRVLDINPRSFRLNDTIWQYSGICKVLKVSKFAAGPGSYPAVAFRKPGVVVHGNVLYDFLYRSYADTPYYQKDFRQHTIQVGLNVSVKDKYTFRFNIRVRQSNSPFFRNFFDGGLQFDRHAYLARMKQVIEKKVMDNALPKADLERVEAALAQQLKKYNKLISELGRPDMAQLLILERERNYFRKRDTSVSRPDATIDPLAGSNIDSSANKIEKYITEKKKELDSVQSNISKLQRSADSLKAVLFGKSAQLRQKLSKAKNNRELKKLVLENGLPEQPTTKAERIISNIRSIGLGRSVVDYSELTVSNVSLTGINIEYNPGIYAAVAAGKIDYGFRDFTGKSNSFNKQQLLMGRIGIGDKDRKALILSVYTGKKYNYGNVLSDTVNNYVNVTGFSLEGILKKNEQTGLSFEVAKSTKPVTGNLIDNKEANSLFKFADRSNLGISIKGQTILPETNTRLSGFFRKTGENFQSFSLFAFNTDQTAWLLKADQSFLKNKIGITAMLRRNDFTNPFTEKTFKTSTVFTSAQLNIRFPKWPSVSVGYYPGSQLYIIDRERVRENVYYIMNGSLVHTYSLLGIKMVSSAIYNQYSNKGTDSGFVNYNGKNYMISHALLFRKLQLNGGFVYTDQKELQFFTLEANADYSPVSSFRIGAGGKYNKIPSGNTYWGGQAQVMLEIRRLGGLQFQYEKSFLPTIYQTLFPVETGRISWFKYF